MKKYEVDQHEEQVSMYRFITWNFTTRSPQEVRNLLARANWEDRGNVRAANNGQPVEMSPAPINYTAQTRAQINVLWDIAPYAEPGSSIILEKGETWVHLDYDGSGVTERETHPGVW